jgi:hypothetical protein
MKKDKPKLKELLKEVIHRQINELELDPEFLDKVETNIGDSITDDLSEITLSLRAIQKRLVKFRPKLVDMVAQATLALEDVQNKIAGSETIGENEKPNQQILKFVQLITGQAADTGLYFNQPDSYTIDGAIDYLVSHSPLFDENPNPNDPEGGLSGFTKSDLIQHAQQAGWSEENIDYMLELNPVKYLERG